VNIKPAIHTVNIFGDIFGYVNRFGAMVRTIGRAEVSFTSRLRGRRISWKAPPRELIKIHKNARREMIGGAKPDCPSESCASSFVVFAKATKLLRGSLIGWQRTLNDAPDYGVASSTPDQDVTSSFDTYRKR
jgi:hypothetical protein